MSVVQYGPNFEHIRYNIQTLQGKGGTVSVSVDRARYGEVVKVVAVPEEGKKLYRLYLDGTAMETDSFTVTGNHIIQAQFVSGASSAADVWDGSSAAPFTLGTGTESDPYQILTAANLAYMANCINQQDSNYRYSYYVLMNDLDLAGHEWTPIGIGTGDMSDSYVSDDYSFNGHFDGNNHVISGLNIKNPKKYCIGLFGVIYSAEIKDLTIRDASVAKSGRSTYLCGILAGGTSCCKITNVIVDGGKVNTEYREAIRGGLVALASNNTEIKNCAATAEIEGTGRYSGGLIGVMNGATVDSCIAAGRTDVFGSTVGGFVGYLMTGSIQYCQTSMPAYGNVAGGFAGQVNNGEITDSYCVGKVTSATKGGGFVGYVAGGNYIRCWSGSSVIGKSGASGGSFAGYYKGSFTKAGDFFVGEVRCNGSTEGTVSSTAVSQANRGAESYYKQLSYDMTNIWKLDGSVLYLRTPWSMVEEIAVAEACKPIVVGLNEIVKAESLTLEVTCSNGFVYRTDTGYNLNCDTSRIGQIQLTVSMGGASTSCSATVTGDCYAVIGGITENLAQVSVRVEAASVLMVAVYEQSGKMVACAQKNVSPGSEQINVLMKIPKLREGYVAKSFLVQPGSYAPVA